MPTATVVLPATTAAGSHHKLLLNPETLKLSTDTLIAAVLQCWVPVEILVDLVEILVDLVEILVDWVVDGVK
jgi:hypothetical protein